MTRGSAQRLQALAHGQVVGSARLVGVQDGDRGVVVIGQRQRQAAGQWGVRAVAHRQQHALVGRVAQAHHHDIAGRVAQQRVDRRAKQALGRRKLILPAEQQQVGALLVDGGANTSFERVRDGDRRADRLVGRGAGARVHQLVELGARAAGFVYAIAKRLLGGHHHHAHDQYAAAVVAGDRLRQRQQPEFIALLG
ncbi:MAG: hypothetical protein U0Z44_16470 [Kouleothrix sp.]